MHTNISGIQKDVITTNPICTNPICTASCMQSFSLLRKVCNICHAKLLVFHDMWMMGSADSLHRKDVLAMFR